MQLKPALNLSRLSRNDSWMRGVSGVIVAILGTQTIATIFGTGRLGWPMISYDMYSYAHFEGERLDEYTVSANLDDGTNIKIEPAELDMTFWIFRRHIVGAIVEKDVGRLAPIVNEYCARYDSDKIAVRVHDLGMAITRHGLITGLPRLEVGRIDLPCRGNVAK